MGNGKKNSGGQSGRAQEARTSEERLREAQRIARLAAWEHDLRTNRTWWSEETFSLLGVDPKKSEARHELFLSLIHPEDRTRFNAEFESMLRLGFIETTFRIVRMDGETRFVRGFATVSYDEGEPIRIQGVNQDVTESRFRRIAFEQQEQLLSAIYSHVPGILFYVGVEPGDRFRFLSVNQAFLQATGLTEDRVAGKLVQEVVPPESAELVLEKYREAVRRRSTVRWEERSQYPSGVKIGDVAITPVFGRDGNVTHLSGVVYDITERRKLEDDLRAAVETRDEFMSIASHELKTPLSALHMQLQLLRRLSSSPGTQADPRIASLVEDTFRSTTALTTLMNALLDVTRIRAGKLTLQPREMDLRTAVLRAATQAEAAAKEMGSTIRVAAEEPVVGSWDPMCVDQVLSNLLSNAIKYGEGNPIDISLSRGPGGTARLAVRDMGMGIAREKQEKIFRRFERAVGGNKITGLGLGLYIAKQMVEAHGGTIRVESEPGKGALFVVVLPLGTAGKGNL